MKYRCLPHLDKRSLTDPTKSTHGLAKAQLALGPATGQTIWLRDWRHMATLWISKAAQLLNTNRDWSVTGVIPPNRTEVYRTAVFYTNEIKKQNKTKQTCLHIVFNSDANFISNIIVTRAWESVHSRHCHNCEEWTQLSNEEAMQSWGLVTKLGTGA